MAIPRVFVSSTCYDLSEVRDSLMSFISSFGFDIALSEKGDVFYHPDLHTHESCIREVSNCQLFILIIGGRFGGSYKVDPNKSIVNAEYIAAKEADIPVFTFIKQDVLDDHRLYQKNKQIEYSIVDKIVFPSMDKNEYAEKIFEFINSVRHADVNNGFFGFRNSKDIQLILKKQWAGMLYDFLSERRLRKQSEITYASLTQVEAASKKIVEIVENIYKQVDSSRANEVLSVIDLKEKATKFFYHIAKKIDSTSFLPFDYDTTLESTNFDNNWYIYLATIPDFEILNNLTDEEGKRPTNIVGYTPSQKIIGCFAGHRKRREIMESDDLQDWYSAFKNLPLELKKEVVSQFMWPF